jgi:hypothetical protein
LESSVPSLKFPTEKEEREDPIGADIIYASAIKWLKEQARGRDFPLVERENAQYGFRRNLLGLKAFGIFICMTTLFSSLFIIHVTHPEICEAIQAKDSSAVVLGIASLRKAALGATVFSFLGIFAWMSIVTDAWVREAGEQYAGALLAVCDRLAKSKSNDFKAEPRIRGF